MSLYDLFESLSELATTSPVALASQEVVRRSIYRNRGAFGWIARALSVVAGAGAFVMSVGSEIIDLGLRVTAYGFVGWVAASLIKQLTVPVAGMLAAVGNIEAAA